MYNRGKELAHLKLEERAAKKASETNSVNPYSSGDPKKPTVP